MTGRCERHGDRDDSSLLSIEYRDDMVPVVGMPENKRRNNRKTGKTRGEG